MNKLLKILYGSEIYHTQVYQRFEDEEKEWLMVRPSYPPFYYERHVRKIEADQAPLVVVYGSWKVGTLYLVCNGIGNGEKCITGT